LAALSQGESGVCADFTYLPGSPLQPAGRPKAGPKTEEEKQKALPSMIPAAAVEPVPRASTSAPPPFAESKDPKPIRCEDACSSGSLKVVFAFEGGRIGADSHLELDAGEAFEIRAYSEQCPHSEGQEKSFSPETLPEGCIFVFSIPAARAAWTGARARGAIRCSAGKIGMSGFHCNESNSPSSSFTSESFILDP
jgi:hypothetical protein